MNSRLHRTIVALSLVATFCSFVNAAEAGSARFSGLPGKPNVIRFQNTTWKPVEVTYLTADGEEVTVAIEKRTTARLELYPGAQLQQVLADGEMLELPESSDGVRYRLTRGLFSRDFSLTYTVPTVGTCDCDDCCD